MSDAPLDLNGYLADVLERAGLVQAEGKAAIDTHMTRAISRDREMANKIAALFSTPAGLEVLHWLELSTLKRGQIATDQLLITPAPQLMNYAIFRAGEDSVVEMIMQAIAQARNKPKPRRRTVK